METHKFNIGDKVMISLDYTHYKHQGFDDDKQMTGVITHVSSGMLSYTVEWENGNTYCYASIHLVLADPYIGKTVLTDIGEGVVIARATDSTEGYTRYFINVPSAQGVIKKSYCETYNLPETCIGMHGKILRICDFKIVTSQPLSTEPVTGEYAIGEKYMYYDEVVTIIGKKSSMEHLAVTYSKGYPINQDMCEKYNISPEHMGTNMYVVTDTQIKSITQEQTKTKTKTLNYNKDENTSKSSGSIKVCNPNFKISEGVGTRGFGLKSSGSKIKLGNNNRNN